MFDTPTTIDNVGARARALYRSDIQNLVEPNHTGRFIAIDPDSGDYEIHDELGGALDAMRVKRPNAYTHTLRIGYKAAITGVRSVANYIPIEPTSPKPVNLGDFWERSQALYDSEIRCLVEPRHSGRFLALDPETGDCAIHDDIVGAVAELGKRLPGFPFYVLCIGQEDHITGVFKGASKE